MFKILISLLLSFVGINTVQAAEPVYFVGTQKVALATKECFVELVYSADQQQVALRAVVTNAHEAHLAPIGPLTAQYKFLAGSIQSNAYYFEDKTPKAAVKQLILLAADPQQPTALTAAVFHDGHHDPVKCEQLQVAESDELAEAIDLFAHFDDLADEEGHSH